MVLQRGLMRRERIDVRVEIRRQPRVREVVHAAHGIAAPINIGLSGEHIAELLRRSGARILVAAGPELAPEVWQSARELAVEAGMEALLALGPTRPGSPERSAAIPASATAPAMPRDPPITSARPKSPLWLSALRGARRGRGGD